jgi:hypothetical protein
MRWTICGYTNIRTGQTLPGIPKHFFCSLWKRFLFFMILLYWRNINYQHRNITPIIKTIINIDVLCHTQHDIIGNVIQCGVKTRILGTWCLSFLELNFLSSKFGIRSNNQKIINASHKFGFASMRESQRPALI